MKLKDTWIFIPCVPFYMAVFNWVQNIPNMDDYDRCLQWIMDFRNGGLSDRLALLWQQYNGHRIIVSKVAYLLDYNLTGSINFKLLCVLGNLQLFGIGLIGVYFIKKYFIGWRFLSFIWMLCVFDLNTYENAMMSVNATSNWGVILFFMASLFFLDKSDRWIWPSVMCMSICVFTNGNGILGAAIIACYAYTKGKRKFLIMSFFVAVLIAVSFIGYEATDIPNKLPFSLERISTFFVRMSGAHFNFDNSFWIGIVVLGLLAYVIPKKPKEWSSAGIVCILGFVVGTMMLATYFRGNTSDAQFQTSRYLIYVQLMVACIIFFLFEMLKTKKQQYIGMAVTLLIMIPTYKHNYDFGELGFERTNARASYYKFWHPHPEEAECISKEADSLGIYHINDNR